MHLNFYGLEKDPFSLTSDPAFLFWTPAHRGALDDLVCGVQNHEGFIVLTGEVGTGKTTLIHALLQRLGPNTAVTFVVNSGLPFDSLIEYVLEDLGIRKAGDSPAQRLFRLKQFLIERRRGGENTLLILDEAQGLDASALEQIRLLSNFEIPTEKLVQILLVGQPELEAKLDQPELRQLKEEIGLRCATRPLTPAETFDYIRTRLRIAGAPELGLFADEAISRIIAYSGGIPRLVNIVCDHCLLIGYTDQKHTISREIVQEAIEQLEEGDGPSRRVASAYTGAFRDRLRVVREFLVSLPGALRELTPDRSAGGGREDLAPAPERRVSGGQVTMTGRRWVAGAFARGLVAGLGVAAIYTVAFRDHLGVGGPFLADLAREVRELTPDRSAGGGPEDPVPAPEQLAAHVPHADLALGDAGPAASAVHLKSPGLADPARGPQFQAIRAGRGQGIPPIALLLAANNGRHGPGAEGGQEAAAGQAQDRSGGEADRVGCRAADRGPAGGGGDCEAAPREQQASPAKRPMRHRIEVKPDFDRLRKKALQDLAEAEQRISMRAGLPGHGAGEPLPAVGLPDAGALTGAAGTTVTSGALANTAGVSVPSSVGGLTGTTSTLTGTTGTLTGTTSILTGTTGTLTGTTSTVTGTVPKL